jgi:hypothetical protein
VRYDCWKGPKDRWVRGTLSLPLEPDTSPEPHEVRQDAFHYRPATATLAEAVERERAITRAIASDPFKHLPPGCGVPTLADIVRRQETTRVFVSKWCDCQPRRRKARS